MALNDTFLQELKYKTDIEDIVSSYVSLKRRGSTFVGLCPFHNEKTPSFTVYPETQSFYCFGCGAGGDAVGFIRRIENLDYIDAVKYLADKAGLDMPQQGFDDSFAKKRRRILQANREAAKFYHSYLISSDGKAGLDYFVNRGLSLKTITHFGLGMAPNTWNALRIHLHNLGFKDVELAEAGLVTKGQKGYYDRFRGRVMTPIIDVRGNVIAFGGRVLDDSKPKYINTNDTLAYKKTNELFALNFAKDSGKDTIILCEGYMDVITMHQAGFTNAVAGCGTALTQEQVKLICRYAKEVILAYDADEAGQKAVARSVEMFKNTDIKVRVPSFSYGKDPDEIIKTVGAEKFGAMLDGATNEIEYKILKLRNKYNLNTTQGKSDFANEVIKILKGVNPIEKDLYLSRISEELGIEKRSLEAQFDNYVSRTSYSDRRRQYNKIISDNLKSNAKISYDNDATTKKIKAEERFIYLLINYPDCYKSSSNFNSDLMSGGFYKKCYDLIISKISSGEDADLMNFGDSLTMDESAKLSGIMARGTESANPKAEYADCVKIIKDEYEKSNKKSLSGLSDDEFRKMFANT